METSNEPLDQGQQFQSTADAPYRGMALHDIDTRLKSVASWFYWIVGLSLLNTAISMMGSDRAFSLGLGITQIIDVVAKDFGVVSEASGDSASPMQIAGWVVNLLILGFFVFLGITLTRRRAAWALWTGVIIYGLDSLIFLIGPQVISLAIHAFVLFKLSQGFGILKEAREITKAQDPSA